MNPLAVWAPSLPPALAELPALVADALGLGPQPVDRPESIPDPAPALIVPAELDPATVADLDRLVSGRTGPTAFVVSDGAIGTNGPGVDAAVTAAATIALARSVAVRQTPTGRVNVVCAPEGLFGAAGSQRGPLRLEIGSAEVADVAAFLLSDHASYIDGQVLFADGGRQLFSSLTA
jgi:hypothetical protein